ncbi:uncharacterized protein LOC109285993 isoform X1 [Alligator mississippiensis]|uniref:uncharacterized protein LOC109285993 isoform X1 n=1 Tax=Alligator mississippiensis TaxID=8496 RepID=UPI0009075229|nr:uncharacterized protein LOC109285993 isoform X1 [Alligator mississippiensis]
MSHAFFRSTFRFLLLLLVLLLANSSCKLESTAEIRANYENILIDDINILGRGQVISDPAHSLLSPREREQRSSPLFAPARERNPQPLKRLVLQVNMSARTCDWYCKRKKDEYSSVIFCNDSQEIVSLQIMACDLLKLLYKQYNQKRRGEFYRKAAEVSCMTLDIIQGPCNEKKKMCQESNLHKHGKSPGKKCPQEVCVLKIYISSLQSCWNKFETETIR